RHEWNNARDRSRRHRCYIGSKVCAKRLDCVTHLCNGIEGMDIIVVKYPPVRMLIRRRQGPRPATPSDFGSINDQALNDRCLVSIDNHSHIERRNAFLLRIFRVAIGQTGDEKLLKAVRIIDAKQTYRARESADEIP